MGRPADKETTSFTEAVLASVSKLQKTLCTADTVKINGNELNMAEVVAVAKYNITPEFRDDLDTTLKMSESVNVLQAQLAAGKTIYGVNTGFGGSADARTDDHDTLQKALIQHHNSGILLPSEQGLGGSLVQDNLSKHNMPAPIVKAAMLVRCNNLMCGHSAVRPEVVRHILILIANDLTPVVPMRGSISASGDLTPMAYIAGALEGNPDIFIDSGQHNGNLALRSYEALQCANLKPLSFLPKEALGLLNGTAFSAGAAAMVLFEANQLLLFSQILTAMCTEALMGTRRNFHPFIDHVRPHPGQTEAARNMYHFLSDSKLATNATPETVGLAQDRYAIRTSSQWIGPQIETLELATRQVVCELNSTTDNPLLDPVRQEVHHGGNFQAASVTSATEKAMTCMQMLGKMIFGQCSEVLNPMFSKGLPPNLCADDPSLSFAFKGVDVNMASYMSELAFIARPVSNFVQSAEMHNQAINSLALIGARYAAETVQILSMMIATHIYVLCQAVDLRVLQLEFERAVKPRVYHITETLCIGVASGERIPHIQKSVWKHLMNQWGRTSNMDLVDRAETSVSYTVGILLNQLNLHRENERSSIPMTILNWQDGVKYVLAQEYKTTRAAFLNHQSTQEHLCSPSRKLYCYVRETLNVPMHRGIADHPTHSNHNLPNNKRSIGSHISAIYIALREGDMIPTLLSCFDIPLPEWVPMEEN
ncbi:phenylalanine ammonia-lyase [Aspergillus ellipticus CBS 707.79]|uniref:Phenylalanine ammonia-lyase n=1 Tax=Aspergillus ellipticus CBS 707.79 TaxID=1448320 RepID=A0A319D9N4_9EURO|nr:phenylalanine ammonia-lyase [Aspergillus ellipticus CBS 707.79]